MEYLVLSQFQVQQIPSIEFPNRNLLLIFTFMNQYEANSTWADLTQTFSIVLPKNVKVRAYKTDIPFVPSAGDVTVSALGGNTATDGNDYVQIGNINGQNSNLGGFTSDNAPLFLRGDRVKFNIGYRAQIQNLGEATDGTGKFANDSSTPDLFAGFISAVSPKLPFTIECQDNMWLLKQMPTPAFNWQKWQLQDIVSKVIKDSQDLPLIKRYGGYIQLSVYQNQREEINFNVQNLTTTRQSLADFLARLHSEYRVNSWFRGNELRMGYKNYIDSDTVNHVFTFQKNILDNDKLKWSRKDDTTQSMIVKSHYIRETGKTTSDGKKKTKAESTEILIFETAGKFDYVLKEKGKDFPTKYLNDIGERFTFNIYDAITDPKILFQRGVDQLKQRYYDGFRGSFTTFGIPYVKHGDTVDIINYKLPEQNGRYKVKAVRYYGGYDDGLRQEIFLDYKVTT